ncbi:hypothetical protein GIB67_026153 [Kingdonia uniflora]|uniref:Uncharacterized protein n=1 Tax=Kingdonia uniflora TaxID=39325 RepID=A0A7J7M378_9MAGN|nr:hypothetical protein GIB67_026153 [Kingdonia uniflora]
MIGKAIQTTCKNVLNEAENLFVYMSSPAPSERVFEISGLPKMGVYDVNFGWGRPKKYELIYTCSLSECGDNANRSLEFSIILKKHEMNAFASIFHKTLNCLLNASSAMPMYRVNNLLLFM